MILRCCWTLARNAVAQAEVLAARDPSWGTEVFAIDGGGWLVLSGAGMYVNRAMAVGIDRPLSGDQLERIVERCAAAGVRPAVEVTTITHPDTVALLAARGFVHEPDHDVTALTYALVPGQGCAANEFAPPIVVRPVLTAADLRCWQDTSALGWGHVEPAARRASDAFTVAAHATDRDGMVVAFDAADGRPLGCASTTIRESVGTLGGMSTIPAERRRGVQTALVQHRLRHAVANGCDLALTTAVTGGASERNLRRLGFTPRFTIATHVLRLPS